MPLKIRFPKSAVAQRSKVESDIVYCIELIRAHFSGQTLPKGMAIDAGHSVVWNQHFMDRLQTPIEGKALTMEYLVQQTWLAASFRYEELRGKTTGDMYEVLNRQHAKVVKVLVGSFFDSDEDVLAFNLKSTTPPTHTQSQDSTHPWASWNSCGIDDIPAYVSMDSHSITMEWNDVYGRLHRDVEKGPALVEISCQDRIVRVQHFNEGARTRGHDKWAKRCSQSNLWLKYTSIEE